MDREKKVSYCLIVGRTHRSQETTLKLSEKAENLIYEALKKGEEDAQAELSLYLITHDCNLN